MGESPELKPTGNITPPQLCFITDNMLRGLARWLRFLGFPAKTVRQIEQLKKLQQEQPEAIFLTSSRKHLSLYSGCSFLIRSDDIQEQLQEINQEFHIFSRMNLLSLCSVCNVPIRPMEKKAVKERIPERVYQQYARFWICPVCGRIYWEGGHIPRLKDKLRRMGIPLPQND